MKARDEILAIIPARGGSKRIPNKNIKKFNGLPIIAWSIKVAKECELFDEVMVSTENKSIAKISKKFGATIPFMRSKKNATDHIPLVNVLKEVLKQYQSIGKNFKYVCCFYAAAPLIKKKFIIEGLKRLKKNKYDSVLSASKCENSIWRTFKKDKKGKIIMNFKSNMLENSNKFPKSYYHDGQWFWINVSKFLKSKIILGKNTGAVLIPPHLSQDINNFDDWRMAEMKLMFSKKKLIKKLK
jgi:pseudaminic acid cytidylyltransferase